jgi:glycosyltransferase involved in cell wall biosynthesis
VVIATRDRPQMLREAIASVVGQRYDGPIETVVVFDQAEPDMSLVTEDTLRPVRVVTNDRSAGLPGARNAGVAASVGAYLAFCDDDDLFLPDKTRRQVDYLLSHSQNEVVVCGIEVKYRDGEVIDRPLDQDILTFDDLLRSRVMQALFQTAMLHRDAWERIGPDDEAIPGGYGEDYEWLLRAARRQPIGVVSEPLVCIRWSGGSFFANRWRTIDEALAYLLDRYPEFSRYRKGHARVLGQRAFALAAAGDRGAALQLAAKTFMTNPLERRTPLAVAVAAGAVPADSIIGWLNARGRGM